LLGLGLAIQANPWEVPAEFMDFIQKYNKTYSPQEFQRRAAIFAEALSTIKQLNANAKENGLSTRFGITKFADLTREEFAATHFGYKKISNIKPVSTPQETAQALPKSFDWRPKGAVTKVKNQEQCGSCWAFSATEGVESAYFLAKKKLIVLSPQQIVSCDTNDDGCNGGDLPTAFQYVQQNGLETDAAYPYTSGGGDSGTCDYTPSDVVVQISGFEYATQSGNETAMQVALQSHGPLSICVDAETWQYYESGVITHGCGDSLDHCVQIVGWSQTTDSTPIPYWIIRNSWGTDWGLSGYLWVERGKDECGVSDEATYVTI
jgi:cathepsin F